MFARYIAVMILWLRTNLSYAFCYLELTDNPTPPVGGTLLGTTQAVQVGVAVLKICRGTGQNKVTYWTGYWTAA
jgi:hypothetical protein